jgi:hypothetical protein
MADDPLGSTAAGTPPVAVPADDVGHNRTAVRSGHQSGSTAVAALLAIAAIVAAMIGTRASIVSGDASDAWHAALRTEVKRSAAAIEDSSFLFLTEFPQAMRVLTAKMTADALRAAEAGQGEEVVQALESEAALQLQLVDLLSATSPLSADPTYALSPGGFDLGKRLAAIRTSGAEGPELVALDPDSLVATGDRLADKATLLAYALIPTSLCAFLGILAKPLRRCRRMLLAGGAVAGILGVAMALAVEVLA